MQKKYTCGENDVRTGNTSMQDLDLPLTPVCLRTLAQQGLLKPEWYEKALLFLGIRPQVSDWVIFWQRILLLTGFLLFMAGVICFFAWNWADMSHFSKFGLIIAMMLASVALPLIKGLDSTAGRLGLLACGLLAGPLLAVFGQYYQTGADAWELFRAWSVFLLLLAILGRQSGLWAAAWLIGSVAGILYIQDNWLSRWSDPFKAIEVPEFILIQALILIAWEGAAFQARHRANSFLHSNWFSRVLAIWVVLILTRAISMAITLGWFGYANNSTSILPAVPLFSGLYILLVGGGITGTG